MNYATLRGYEKGDVLVDGSGQRYVVTAYLVSLGTVHTDAWFIRDGEWVHDSFILPVTVADMMERGDL